MRVENEGGGDEGGVTPSRAWAAVIVLLAMYMLALVDRQILSLMVTPIRRDLGLSEVQIGLLQGFAFVLLFASASIPLGWAMDRFSRRWLILAGVIVWSISCGAAALATDFWGLFWSRVGVGVGEAVILPGAYSILSDMFARKRLSLALGVFSIGGNLGVFASLMLGGLVLSELSEAGGVTLPLLGALTPWQAAFFFAALPGIPLSLLMLTVPEPRRRVTQSAGSGFLRPVFSFMKHNPRAAFALTFGFTFNAMIAYSLLAWTPVYLERSFGWGSAQIGKALGTVLGVGGALAPLAAGLLADRLFRRGVHDINFRASIVGYLAIIPFGLVGYLTPYAGVALACLAVMQFISAFHVPNAAAALQLSVPGALRGRMTATYVFVASMVGQGLGPLIVAAVTEHGLGGDGMVGASLAIVVTCAAIAGALVLLFGLRPYRALVEREGEAAALPAKVTGDGATPSDASGAVVARR